MTSFLALRGDDETSSMLGRVASIGDGVAASIGKLLGARPSQKNTAQPPTQVWGLKLAAAACTCPVLLRCAGSEQCGWRAQERQLPNLASVPLRPRQRWAWLGRLPRPGARVAASMGLAVLVGAVGLLARARPAQRPLFGM